MDVMLIILAISGCFYLLAFVYHSLTFAERYERGHQWAFVWLQTGFVINTVYFFLESVQKGVLPIQDSAHAMAFFAWSLAFVYLVILVRSHNDSFGLILTPVLFGFVTASFFFGFHGAEPKTLPPSNPFFMIHIVSAFFAYASFAISFAAGVLFLIQQHELKSKSPGAFYHKLPSLEELEKLTFQPIAIGAILLFVAVVIGAVWSKTAFDNYGIGDPKTLATVAVTLVYLAILFLRNMSALRTKQVALLSVVAFALVIMSFVGMRFMQGSHNFVV